MFIRFAKDKKHIEEYDGSEINELSDSPDGWDDAGYVLENNDLIVDVDDLPQEVVKILLETFDIQTQSVWSNSGEHEGHHGVHLYFKKPAGFKGGKRVSALGFEVEYKVAPQTKYVTVKRHGKLRRVENKGIREELPDCLKPKSNGSYKSLLGYEEGDGRDDALFAHRASITTIPKWRQIVKFINDYIFAEPLPVEDIERISREVDITPTKDNQFDMATLIMRELNIVKYGEVLYFRHGDSYEDSKDILERLVWQRCEGMNSRYVNEIMTQMEGRARLIDTNTIFPIKFKNGILRDGEFIHMDYTEFTPYAIDLEYKKDAEPVDAVDDYLDHLTGRDKDYKLFIGEILGHIFIKNPFKKNTLPHIFFFIGGGGNGKGTLLKIIEKIVGVHNASHLDIQKLTKEQYLSSINQKLVNLGDDVRDKTIDDDEIKILKNVSSCDTIPIRKLYEESKSVTPTVSLIFTTNHVLKSFEKGESVRRRMMWCPMYSKVTKKDPGFIGSVTTVEALEYWVRLAVEGYLRLYEGDGEMTHNEPVFVETTKYHQENNLSQLFVDDLEMVDVQYEKPKNLYERYEKWCEDEGIDPTSRRIFYQNIEDTFDVIKAVRKIDDKSHRVYVSRTETSQEGA